MEFLWGLFGLWLLYKIIVGFRFMVLGVRQLRFTLQSMMTLVVIVGACGALLSDPKNHYVFCAGIASSMVAVGFLISYLIILGMYEGGSPRVIAPGTVRLIKDLEFRPVHIAAEAEVPTAQPTAQVRILSGQK